MNGLILMLFILSSLLAIAMFVLSAMNYLRLKKCFAPPDKESGPSLNFVDVLFNPKLKDDPAARKIQKRAIWFFCFSLLMVNLASYFYAK